MKRTLLSVSIVVAAAICAPAQTIKVPESWDKLAAKADDVVNVSLDKKMLQFASKFMVGEDENEKHLVSKLNGIYVHSLEFKNEGEFTESDVDPIRTQLQGPEWIHIVDVHNKTERENVVIYLKMVNNQSLGMAILVEEPKELTFVHLDGPISPGDLSDLSGSFGIPKNLHVSEKETSKPKAEIKK